MFARHFIDSLDFARNGLELRGEAAIAEMPRLQDALAAPEGRVSYVLRGLPGRNGKSLLELTLDGGCQLRCQRCLQGLPYPIKTISRLMPVPEIELEGFLPESGEMDEEDGIDCIPADVHMDVLNLIEEEILLGLPLAPMHEVGACHAATESTSRDEKNPFAILHGLKNE
ncbi:MAG TPA: YceD family protein [Gallionellaceae bacterium]|nr:YceD family protein [Gallionellaceae bacterium]